MYKANSGAKKVQLLLASVCPCTDYKLSEQATSGSVTPQNKLSRLNILHSDGLQSVTHSLHPLWASSSAWIERLASIASREIGWDLLSAWMLSLLYWQKIPDGQGFKSLLVRYTKII